MQKDMNIWRHRNSAGRGKTMRRTYKCSNVKFCMEDENQRRTWEYLQGITRKDGSYGKVLSDVFAAYLDGQDLRKTSGESAVVQDERSVDLETLEQVLEKIMEKLFIEMQEVLAEQIRNGFNEFAGAVHLGVGSASDELDKARIEQTQEQELSEDMMAFAFGMGE